MTVASAQPTRFDTEPAAIRVQNLHKSYDKTAVLRGVELEVPAGARVVVCGPSGSGKSTLLRCLNALETIDSGTVTVAGVEISALRGRALHRARADIGMVFQQFGLYPHLSVLDNVTLAPRRVRGVGRNDADQYARQLLAEVGLDDKARSYPPQLSGGQQQRVAIVRALAMRPRVMLFDEPTSALDPEMVGEVLSVMRRLADSGITMVVVSHEMSFARDVADTMVLIDDGQIVEQARPDDLINAPREPRTKQFMARIQQH